MSDERRPEAEEPRIDALVEELRQRVERRRREGAYPEGLEARLDSHATRILERSGEPAGLRLTELETRMSQVRQAARFDAIEFSFNSRMPGGRLVHRVFARLLSRYLGAVQAQMEAFADSVVLALEEVVESVRDPGTHDHVQLRGQVDAVLETLAVQERERAELEATLQELDNRSPRS